MQDPKLQEAFLKSIKHYFDDNGLEETDKISPDRKFNKKYFDTLDSELNPDSEDPEVKKLKTKPKSKSPSKSSQLRVR